MPPNCEDEAAEAYSWACGLAVKGREAAAVSHEDARQARTSGLRSMLAMAGELAWVAVNRDGRVLPVRGGLMARRASTAGRGRRESVDVVGVADRSRRPSEADMFGRTASFADLDEGGAFSPYWRAATFGVDALRGWAGVFRPRADSGGIEREEW